MCLFLFASTNGWIVPTTNSNLPLLAGLSIPLKCFELYHQSSPPQENTHYLVSMLYYLLYLKDVFDLTTFSNYISCFYALIYRNKNYQKISASATFILNSYSFIIFSINIYPQQPTKVLSWILLLELFFLLQSLFWTVVALEERSLQHELLSLLGHWVNTFSRFSSYYKDFFPVSFLRSFLSFKTLNMASAQTSICTSLF